MNFINMLKRIKENVITKRKLQYFFRTVFVFMVFARAFLALSHFNRLSSFDWGEGLLRALDFYIAPTMILVCLLLQKYTKFEFKIYFAILIFAVMRIQFGHFIGGTAYGFFPGVTTYFVALILLVREEKIAWVTKTLFITYVAIFVTVVGFYITGVIPPYLVFAGGHGGGNARNALGFFHPNIASAMFLIIFIAYLLYTKKTLNLLILASFVILFFVIDNFTHTRSVLITSILMITGILLLNILPKKIVLFFYRYEKYILISLPVVFLLVSYGLSYFFTYDNALFVQLDRQFLSGRTRLGSYYIGTYPIRLWGNPILINVTPTTDLPWLHLDNAFLTSLLLSGVIHTIIRFVYFAWIGIKLKEYGFKYATIIMMSVMLLGFSERIILNPSWNIVFILGGVFLREQERKRI